MPDRAGVAPPPGARRADEAEGGEERVTVSVRYEPLGPTRPVPVPRTARLEEVKEAALAILEVEPETAERCFIALNGRLLNEASRLTDHDFGDLAILSVGLLDDVYFDYSDHESGSL